MSLEIEPLSTRHDRRGFSRGVVPLDEYLRRYARQHADTNVSRTYVAAEGRTVRGYYSLAMAGIREKLKPERIPRGLQGPGITLIIVGLMALAFIGFTGVLSG